MFRDRLLTRAVQYRDRKGAAEQASRKCINYRRRPRGRRSQNLSVFRLIHDLPSDLFAVVVGVAEHNLRRFGAFVIKL
jgi:hypothetical protein